MEIKLTIPTTCCFYGIQTLTAHWMVRCPISSPLLVNQSETLSHLSLAVIGQWINQQQHWCENGHHLQFPQPWKDCHQLVAGGTSWNGYLQTQQLNFDQKGKKMAKILIFISKSISQNSLLNKPMLFFGNIFRQISQKNSWTDEIWPFWPNLEGHCQ